MELKITHRGNPVQLPDPPTIDTKLSTLRESIATALQTSPDKTRLLAAGKQLKHAEDGKLISEVLKPGAKVVVLAPPRSAITSLTSQTVDATARPDELSTAPYSSAKYVAAPRRTSSSNPVASSQNTFGFGVIEALPGHSDTAQAQAILERLASDKGIQSAMREKNWRVGALREMPPVGRVSEEPCVLGYNVGNGVEIRLRLRTDDWSGFRTVAQMLHVLAHELAHNVESEHNVHFKEVMRWVERRVQHASDWRGAAGRVLGDGDAAPAVSSREVARSVGVVGTPGADGQRGHRLGGGQGRGVSRLLMDSLSSHSREHAPSSRDATADADAAADTDAPSDADAADGHPR